MTLHARTLHAGALNGIRMYVIAAVHPGSCPWPVVDEDRMVGPAQADAAPAVWSKAPHENARPKRNRAPYIEPRPGPCEHDVRIVIRHEDGTGVDRHNFDVSRPCSDDPYPII